MTVASCVRRDLGRVPYEPTWRQMQALNDARDASTPDELWVLEHPPVYTLGMAGKPEHLLCETDIPMVRIDRGGQITYHGPGQIVVYLLIDLRRRGLKVREMVHLMEQALIDTLADDGLAAERQNGAPGVYIGGAKVAALGLRVKNGCSYHGLSLNVDMDLTPFTWINPCGYSGLQTTQLRDLGVDTEQAVVADRLIGHLERLLPPLRAGALESASD
ncbi:lipoyl(octanoyl) transferase LipB [Denitromonas ohlonensis]|uniref:Octanoyltransferase n=2 Tax=Denitromonas TaxID=139331 RepID=A0A557RR45_9RHOO|nr:lipoyl(octanoyl) transferase LipB [Denitromonas ohlonensis]TVO67636.1 lipoyl(octanoyl) transferase LipB [Denitromonas ohlonensis]TVO76494.1 lipoyl(octanoyl) transferase LipB [Denitromonas ohlonensis]